MQLIDALSLFGSAIQHSLLSPAYSAQLFNFAPALFPVSLACKRLLDTQLFARLQVKGMPFDLFNDVFLLYLALESPESVFQGFTVLESYFRQTYDTSKPTIDSPEPPSARVLISYELDFQSQAHKAFSTPRSSLEPRSTDPISRPWLTFWRYCWLEGRESGFIL
jgi:hypothetical protein